MSLLPSSELGSAKSDYALGISSDIGDIYCQSITEYKRSDNRNCDKQ